MIKRMQIGRAVAGGLGMGLVVVLVMLLGTVFGGCALNTQVASTTSTGSNGVVTVTKARSTTYAWGDAKTVIDKTRASAGKTSSVGSYGINEETTSTNYLNLAERIGKAFLAVP